MKVVNIEFSLFNENTNTHREQGETKEESKDEQTERGLYHHGNRRDVVIQTVGT